MELEPGQPLDEVRLSEEFNVSRTPMRDILRRLAGEGYVQIRDQRGTVVAPMDPKSMRNFFLTAPMIYAATSRLAAQLATSAQIDDLAVIQKRFK
ncbi:MAG: GntR family transcriptional regulator, partial [Alphaproteobacteria bacterium]|nr:GntR family transcriptional regulator [Alphaproteobacteria bacterium]